MSVEDPTYSIGAAEYGPPSDRADIAPAGIKDGAKATEVNRQVLAQGHKKMTRAVPDT